MRLFLIQKKIFKASKQYNKYQVYQLQKYLLNSNEGKIISIDYITKAIIKHCKIYSRKTLKISYNHKIILLKLLFIPISHTYSYLYTILNNIKQYLLFLCIKPEWQAKIDFRENEKISIYIFNHFNINKLISKMQSCKYINKYIFYWFQQNFFLDNNNLYIFYSKKIKKYELDIYPYKSLYMLPILLNQIFDIGYNWYYFFEHKFILKYPIFNFCFESNILNILQYNKIKILYNLQTIKLIIYNIKNLIDFYRYKVTKDKLKDIIVKYTKLIYDYNFCFISIQDIILIYSIINKVIYYVLRKQLHNLTNINCIYNHNLNWYLYSLRYKKLYYLNLLV